MHRLDSIPARPLAVLAAALFLSTVTVAQTYTAAAGDSIAGSGDFNVASFPTVSFWDGSWTQSTRHAWSRADQGTLEGMAYCQTYALYNMEAYGIAEFQFDDVVFSSTGSGSIQVGLQLTIEGNSSVVNGNGFHVALKHGTHLIGDATLAAGGGVTSSNDLTGWNMTSGFSFEPAMTVPVNTPVSLKIHMDVSASAVAGGHVANGHYTLRLGGASPLPLPGDRYEVFSLPAGVTVDSVTGGIADNVWSAPDRLHLFADRTTVAPGEALQLVAWNGAPGDLIGLSMGWGPAPPPPAIGPRTWSGFLGALDGDGWWWMDPIPHAPELAGRTVLIRAISLDASGVRMRSEEVAIQFQ